MKKMIICALGISLQTLFAATPQAVTSPSNNPHQSLYDSFIGKKSQQN